MSLEKENYELRTEIYNLRGQLRSFRKLLEKLAPQFQIITNEESNNIAIFSLDIKKGEYVPYAVFNLDVINVNNDLTELIVQECFDKILEAYEGDSDNEELAL